MLAIVSVMVLVLLVGGVVLAYVAFPHRGASLPVAPLIGDVMRKGVDALPTIGEEERDERPAGARAAR